MNASIWDSSKLVIAFNLVHAVRTIRDLVNGRQLAITFCLVSVEQSLQLFD